MKFPFACLLLATTIAGCANVPAPEPQVRQLRIGEVSLAYVEQGRGEAVVFVHGAAGDWRTWEPLRPYIAARHRFVSYSRRYHHPNPADGGNAPYTNPQQADDLIAFVRGLGAGPVHAMGASAGGRILAEAALKSPELFHTVTLSEPLMTRPTLPADLALSRAVLEEFGKVAAAARAGDAWLATVNLVDFVFGEEGAFKRLPSDRQQKFIDNQSTVLASLAAAPTPPPTCEQLAGLRMPVMVMEGELTRAGFRATNNRLMQCLPQGSVRFVVPGAPHTWYPVNPKAGARAILDFIAGTR